VDFYLGKSVTLYVGYSECAAPRIACPLVIAANAPGAEIPRNPEFLAEADRPALEIDLVTGETLQAMVERMFGSPPDVVEAARRAAGQRREAACGNFSRQGRRRGPLHQI
jgi:hypothetical protein